MLPLPAVRSYLGAPLGRRRTKDLDLPPKMYRRGSHFYYVSESKWYPLGDNKAKAFRLWARLEAMPQSLTVGQLVRQWLAEGPRKKTGESLSANTLRQYGAFAKSIETELPLAVEELTLEDVIAWQDRCPRVWFNGCLSVLRNALRWGIRQQLCKENPLRDAEFNETRPRGRYITDDEFRRIRLRAPLWLKTAMDLAYVTGMRESDVLALRWDAVNAEGMDVRQIKTGTRQRFEISPALREVLASARNRPVVGLYVIATENGRPITKRRLQAVFASARAAAAVDDATFHDIRGKAATDAAADGLDYQALLGHTSKRMSDRYVKAKQVIRATALRKRI